MKYITKNMGPVLSVPDPDTPWKEKLVLNPFLDGASKIGSFEDYCRGHFHDDYLKALRSMIADKTLPVGKSSRIVPEPDDIYVDEICIKTIKFGMDDFIYSPDNELHDDVPGYPFCIRMRAVVTASILVSETWEGKYSSDKLTQWYHIDGHTVFYGNDRNEFYPVDSVAIYDRDLPPFSVPLDPYLKMYIGNDDLDKLSYRILNEVFPESLEKPMRIDPRKIVRRLKLNITTAKLSDDHSRFGQIVMRDCVLDINGEPVFVKARTILIDREACRKKRGGRTARAILHECIHYIIHRPFYEAQRLYNKELACLCCEVNAELDKGSVLFFVEWQADNLASHMMILEFTARDFIESELQKLRRRYPDSAEKAILEKLVPTVSDRFNTSKQSTRTRLKALGYGSSRKEQPLYQISPEDAENALRADKRLKDLLLSGAYIYTGGHFCRNSPEYIQYDADGKPELTGFALADKDNCCIPFRERSKPVNYDPDSFYMEEITGTEIVYGGNTETYKKTFSEAYDSVCPVLEDLPSTVGGTLKSHMKRLHVTVEDLEELAQVSQTVIKSIRANNCSGLAFEYFIAICLGLKLEPPLNFDLIRKTRYQFDSSRESTMYIMFFTSMYYAGIDACNEELVKRKMKPLTRKAKYR